MRRNFRCDWVLINKIAIGPAPQTDIDLEILKKEGIKSIFSLCSENELDSNLDLSQTFICKRYVLPDHRYGRIPILDELIKALSILKELQINSPTFVHCVASMERSPLVCLGWLVYELGYPPETALDYLMQVHPGTSPLQEQLNLLNQLSLNKKG